MNILDLTIREIHQALKEKRTTPLLLTQEAISRAKEDKNNAFEYIAEQEALEFASTLTEFEEDNLLYGIPYVLKDNFSTKDIPTTASSNILANYVPVFDAEVVRLLRNKKCVLIGKTTLDELAMGGTGTTGHLGITHNPYSKDRLCGGSSCGSAAAVAAAIVPFALGSDTGDSVRKPASFVGLVGCKPTWGRISRFGLFPFAPSLDHVAYFTRSVEDSAILLEALAGKDLKDATSSEVKTEVYSKELATSSLAGKRIGYIKEVIDSLTDKRTISLFNDVLNKMKLAGAEIVPLSMDKKLLEAVVPTYFVISCAEAGSNNANLDGVKFGVRKTGSTYEETIKNTRTAGFSELIKRRFIIGSFALMNENRHELFIRAEKARRVIVEKLNLIMNDVDEIILPAAPSIAPKFTDSTDKLSNEYLIADNHLALGNFAGLPSITLPMGFIEDMPVGLNLMGKKFEESLLFEIAKGIEDITRLSNISLNNKGAR
ncbi:MAG: amidase family protein [Bacilli bacterium]